MPAPEKPYRLIKRYPGGDIVTIHSGDLLYLLGEMVSCLTPAAGAVGNNLSGARGEIEIGATGGIQAKLTVR